MCTVLSHVYIYLRLGDIYIYVYIGYRNVICHVHIYVNAGLGWQVTTPEDLLLADKLLAAGESGPMAAPAE